MIRLIVAVDRKMGMAKHGGQPWYIPHDEHYFTEKTKSLGGYNLIGKTTYETFKGPLKDRKNFVLTPSDTPIEGAELIHNLETFLRDYKDRDIWVVGGANVFKQVIDMGYADELYITHIDADFGCHLSFPEYKNNFELKEQTDWMEENGFRFRYAIYRRAT